MLHSTRRHPAYLLFPLFLLLAGVAFLTSKSCPVAVALHLDGRCYWITAAAFVFAGAVLSLDWWGTRYVLTTARVMKVQTPVWLRTESLRLSSVESLTLEVGLLGRALGYGTISVDSSATRCGRIVLDFVPDPQLVFRRISEARRRNGTGSTG